MPSYNFIRSPLRWLIASICVAAQAQPAQDMTHIGFVFGFAPKAELSGAPPASPYARAFLEALREKGWTEGVNVRIHWRTGEGKPEKLGPVISELASIPVEIIVVLGNAAAIEAMKRTKGTPIVMASAYHPDEYGIVASLARPGGRITGALLEPGRGINAKRLALLKETIPGLKRVAYLANRNFTEDVHAEVQEAGRAQGITVFPVREDQPAGFDGAFAEAVRRSADALIVGSGGIYTSRETQLKLHELAIRHRLPVMHCLHELGQSGGLMSYATDLRDNYRITARLVDSILRGARPADLPMEQATRFFLTINRKAARSIGLRIPDSVLMQADRVIE